VNLQEAKGKAKPFQVKQFPFCILPATGVAGLPAAPLQ
jgi:hypothetical protein